MYSDIQWGDHDEKQILQDFERRGALPPIIMQADAGSEADTQRLLQTLKSLVPQIDIFISNVSSALLIKSFEAYSLKRTQTKHFLFLLALCFLHPGHPEGFWEISILCDGAFLPPAPTTITTGTTLWRPQRWSWKCFAAI
jgi:hypothetical protein